MNTQSGKETGLGVQTFSERKKLQMVKSTLEDAMAQLGYPSEHVRLVSLIDSAIEEAAVLVTLEDNILNDAA
jgi:hypothetical protein